MTRLVFVVAGMIVALIAPPAGLALVWIGVWFCPEGYD
jgi:hypothetical protein